MRNAENDRKMLFMFKAFTVTISVAVVLVFAFGAVWLYQESTREAVVKQLRADRKRVLEALENAEQGLGASLSDDEWRIPLDADTRNFLEKHRYAYDDSNGGLNDHNRKIHAELKLIRGQLFRYRLSIESNPDDLPYVMRPDVCRLIDEHGFETD